MLSKSGLMSLCCNLDEGYILQVINIENQNPLLTRYNHPHQGYSYRTELPSCVPMSRLPLSQT